ncbi:uncharacterized protein O3C94_012113 isoform 1-T1 [Discoglossus pictus]
MANAQSPLQDKYELLASSLAQVLHVSVWAKLKAVWCTHMSPRELQTARTFILSLLNRGQVSLWDITNLKRQLEDLGDRKGVQLCQEYEDHVTHHLQGSMDQRYWVNMKQSPPINNQRVPEENDELLNQDYYLAPRASINIQETPLESPVYAMTRTKRVHLNGTATDLGQGIVRDNISTAWVDPPLMYNSTSGDLSSHSQLQISRDTAVSDGTKADISCNAVKSMPSTDFFQPLQSCDYDGDLSTPVILQISNITIAEKIDDRPPDSLWSEDVVSGFTNLPDFSPMEAEALLPFLQPPAKCPVPCVQQFLLEFQSQPDARAKLRDLAQHLKKLQRVDVVASMHKQKTLLQSLGPVLPEEQPIKDMKISLWQQVTTALSITKPTGNDWTWLADKLRIPRSFVELWQQRSSHPAAEVLKSWEVKVSEATVGRLFDLMMEMEREDVASML